MNESVVLAAKLLLFEAAPAARARRVAHLLNVSWEQVHWLQSTLQAPYETLAKGLGDEALAAFDSGCMAEDFAFGNCQSPIEELFLAYLIDPYDDWHWQGSAPTIARRGEILIAQQQQVGKYKLDFALTNSARGLSVGVEIDGHAFHERTKEQAQRDKSRDRAIQAEGWRVLRFTGSEVWANPHKCVVEALSQARGA